MFTHSLLYDFLIDNGIKIKNDSTMDIVGMEFNFGTRSYEEEVNHLKKLSKQYKKDNDYEKRKRIIKLMLTARKNKYKYIKKSKEEIRTEYYKNGVSIQYVTHNKKGEIKDIKTIKYKMLFRSTGKAKKGSCMFIREELYDKTYKFLTMGIKLPSINAPIVELNAYIPLVASTIVDKVQIDPKNILILKDVDSYFKTKVVNILTNKNKECYAQTENDYTLKNTLFDGQGLVDSSVFPKWADGYVLLRHHFCKMACFNTNIQMFFKDYFKDDYDVATVTDMFGNEHYVKDIKLITTDNAMKWIKFDVPYEYWCDKVNENDNMFGIVKTAHESKLGDVQRMSYQMVNTLDLNTMDKVVGKSVDYIEQLKTDDDVFLDYLEKNANFSNDYEVLVALCNQNRNFLRSEHFRNRKKEIIRTYVKNFKSGKIIQDADNLVMVGSPYAMLLHSVGLNAELDDSFATENGAIQCYTERFDNGEYLASFRSPHNSCNNICCFHNVYSENMQKYFNLGKLIVAVNVVHTDVQDRLNG